MTPDQLRAHIRPLPEYLPRTREMERAIGVGAGFDRAWYRSQKQHWLGWLAEYHGPGAYGRTDAAQRNGAYIYNHIQCAPMLFWLCEALGVESGKLDRAFCAVEAARPKGAAQCGALRKEVPWELVEEVIQMHSYSAIARLRIKLASFR